MNGFEGGKVGPLGGENGAPMVAQEAQGRGCKRFGRVRLDKFSTLSLSLCSLVYQAVIYFVQHNRQHPRQIVRGLAHVCPRIARRSFSRKAGGGLPPPRTAPPLPQMHSTVAGVDCHWRAEAGVVAFWWIRSALGSAMGSHVPIM